MSVSDSEDDETYDYAWRTLNVGLLAHCQRHRVHPPDPFDGESYWKLWNIMTGIQLALGCLGLKPKLEDPTYAKPCIEFAASFLTGFALEQYDAVRDKIATWDEWIEFLQSESVAGRRWQLHNITQRFKLLKQQPGQDPSGVDCEIRRIERELQLARIMEDERRAWNIFHCLDQELQNVLRSEPNETFRSSHALMNRAKLLYKVYELGRAAPPTGNAEDQLRRENSRRQASAGRVTSGGHIKWSRIKRKPKLRGPVHSDGHTKHMR